MLKHQLVEPSFWSQQKGVKQEEKERREGGGGGRGGSCMVYGAQIIFRTIFFLGVNVYI